MGNNRLGKLANSMRKEERFSLAYPSSVRAAVALQCSHKYETDLFQFSFKNCFNKWQSTSVSFMQSQKKFLVYDLLFK